MGKSDMTQRGWFLRVVGNDYDLEQLSKVLVDDPSLVHKDNAYYLSSRAFEQLADPDLVLTDGRKMVEAISGLAALELGARVQLRAGDPHHVAMDGTKTVFAAVSFSATTNLHAASANKNEHGEVVIRHAGQRVSEWLPTATSEQAAQRALRLRGKQNLDWPDLHRIYEVIEHAVGKGTLVSRNWASHDTISRFKSSANSPSIAGDSARHGKETRKATKSPMTLDDAHRFVDSLLKSWLEWLHSTKGAR